MNHGQGVDSLGQESQTPIDLSKPLLPVDVIGVFRTVPECCRHRDLLGHKRTLHTPKMVMLGLQSRESLRRDVRTIQPFCSTRIGHGPTIAFSRHRVKTGP